MMLLWGGWHLPSGLLGTAHPCPHSAPLPGHCLLTPSFPMWGQVWGSGTRVTEENKRLSLNSSKSIQGGMPGAISTTGRPSASPGKGGSGRAAQGSKELAFGFSRDVCLLLGRGACHLGHEVAADREGQPRGPGMGH